MSKLKAAGLADLSLHHDLGVLSVNNMDTGERFEHCKFDLHLAGFTINIVPRPVVVCGPSRGVVSAFITACDILGSGHSLPASIRPTTIERQLVNVKIGHQAEHSGLGHRYGDLNSELEWLTTYWHNWVSTT